MEQAEVDTYKRLNFFCQEQMKHRLKTAILNEDQTRGQRPHYRFRSHHLYKLLDRIHEKYMLNKLIGMFPKLVFRIWILFGIWVLGFN